MRKKNIGYRSTSQEVHAAVMDVGSSLRMWGWSIVFEVLDVSAGFLCVSRFSISFQPETHAELVCESCSSLRTESYVLAWLRRVLLGRIVNWLYHLHSQANNAQKAPIGTLNKIFFYLLQLISTAGWLKAFVLDINTFLQFVKSAPGTAWCRKSVKKIMLLCLLVVL